MHSLLTWLTPAEKAWNVKFEIINEINYILKPLPLHYQNYREELLQQILYTFFFLGGGVLVDFRNWRPLQAIARSPSWEINVRSTGQEILRLLCKPNIYNCVHKSPPPDCILQTAFYVQVFRLKFRMLSLINSSVLHVPPILLSLNWPP
jgi:hypothetical protein